MTYKFMDDPPDRDLDPPDHWSCEECGAHFYPSWGDEPVNGEPSLCYECRTFDG